MSDTKHTPGPWKYETGPALSGRYHCVSAPELMYVCGCSGGPEEERECNARLIAAAPELLEALEAANRLLWSEGYTTSHEVVANIELVLNKAKGEDQ